jgi:hypothetical protein
MNKREQIILNNITSAQEAEKELKANDRVIKRAELHLSELYSLKKAIEVLKQKYEQN